MTCRIGIVWSCDGSLTSGLILEAFDLLSEVSIDICCSDGVIEWYSNTFPLQEATIIQSTTWSDEGGIQMDPISNQKH